MFQLEGSPIHLVGNAHLDPAWMWRMSEGFEAFSATCRSALARMEEFPGFIFTASSAAQYEFVEQTDPNLFLQIQEAVKEGKWCIVGGWWVEADCNLPSGESFIRQALLGQRYFQSRFGRIVTVGYNIDSFGHNANLPQLLKKAGMNSYVFMRPQQDEKKLSAALFEWEAPSGDRITTYRLPFHYSNWRYSIQEKIELLPTFELFEPAIPWMLFFGVGNHGGGPTIDQLREIESLRSDATNLIYSSPERFFTSIDRDSIPTIHEEMQPHAIGCYSAHSEIKRLNRLAERMLDQAERAQVLELLSIGDQGLRATTPNGDLIRAWKNVCFNQFHDILGGVAIKEACDDAISMYRESISIAERIQRVSLQGIASRIDTSKHIENLIVFNLSAHDREEIIEFELWHPEASEKGKLIGGVFLLDSDGIRTPTQKIPASGKIGEDRVRFVAKVSVPAFGWNTYGIERTFSPLSLKNEAQKFPFEYTPAIIVHDESDTWAHEETSFTEFEEPFHVDSIEVIEQGPIRNGIRIHSSGGNSRMEEEIFFEKWQPIFEIRYLLDWREQNKILKLRFRHGCINPVARYEIPYAWVERPLGPEEWPGQSWVAVSEKDGSSGVVVITDSKYSYSVDEEFIYILAARSPLYAHHAPPHESLQGERKRYQDQGEQEFRVLFLSHDGDWDRDLLARLKNPLVVHSESRHEGTLLQSFKGLDSQNTAILIGAIKKAEDSDGIIVRAIEEAGESSNAEFSFFDANWNATFHSFEIKSFLIQNGKVSEVDFLERAL